jgi:CheY-like chemotaxis protein
MPEMDGFEAAAAIRGDEAADGGRRTPIVALTADALPQVVERSRAAGMDDHLTKPVTTEQLVAVVARWAVPRVPAPSAAAQEVLDRGVLATLQALERDGRSPVLRSMIGIFLRDTSAKLAALEEAVAQEDAGRVEDLAHWIKGSAATLGATRMSRLCAALREAARRTEFGEAAALVAELRHEYARSRAALEALPTAPGAG